VKSPGLASSWPSCDMAAVAVRAMIRKAGNTNRYK
jgi:hypothetical protein